MERYGQWLRQLRKNKRVIVPETAEDATCFGEMRVGDAARKKGRSDIISWKRFFEKFRKNKNKNKNKSKNKNRNKGDYTEPKYKQLKQQDSRPQLQIQPTIELIESPICPSEFKVRAEPATLYRMIDLVQTKPPTRTSHHYSPTAASTDGKKVMKDCNPSKGLSMLTLALGMILLDSRACAVLGMCAWFYLSRCFTSKTMAQKTTSKKCDEEIDTKRTTKLA